MEAGVFAIILILTIFPFLHVLFSGRSDGGAKLGWLIAVLCFSWIAWAIFLIVTQRDYNDRRRGY